MSTPLSLPTPEAVQKLLAALVGKTIAVKRQKPPPKLDCPIVSTYVDREGTVLAIGVAELKLASSAAAALVMIPAGVAENDARLGKLSPDLLENYAEVANVSAALFNSAGEHRVRLGRLYQKSGELPPAVAALMKSSAQRLDLQLDIQGYFGGRLVLQLAA